MKTLIENSTQEIISNTDRGVLVVANAGAGKTTLLVDYFFELISQGFNPEGIITFTFTEKAANELKERILGLYSKHPFFKDLPPELIPDWKARLLTSPIGTIHQFCLRLIREAQSPEMTLNLKIIDQASELQLREAVLHEVLRDYFLKEDPQAMILLQAYGISTLKSLLREYLEHQNTSYGESISLPASESLEANYLGALEALAKPIREKIRLEKQDRGWINFDDMEHQALALLKNPTPFLKKRLGLFTHALVDEFQDTSPIQIQILETLQETMDLLEKKLTLFCVGDPKQSIYRFRKVDRNLISKMEQKILAHGGKKFQSVKNYRSAPPLLEFINAFSQKAFPEAKASEPTQEQVTDSGAWLMTVPTNEEKLSASQYREQEAALVSSQIQALLHQGKDPDQIAVLFRSSASALPLMKVLKKKKIPFSIRGGQELMDRQEILDLKRLLCFLSNPSDAVSLVGILRSPFFLISDATLLFLIGPERDKDLWKYLIQGNYPSELEKNFPEDLKKLCWAVEILRQLINFSFSLSPTVLLKDFIQKWNLEVIYSLAYQDEGCLLAIEQFLDWLEQLEIQNAPLTLNQTVQILKSLEKNPINKTPLSDILESKDCVHLLTIHAAKGLEFEEVFLIDLERAPPNSKSKLQNVGAAFSLKMPEKEAKDAKSERFSAIEDYHSQENFEENKRLLYVALTRAKLRLFITLHPKPGNKNNLQNLLLDTLGEDAMRFRHGIPFPDFIEKPSPVLTDVNKSVTSLKRISSDFSGLQKILLETTVSELETFQVCPLKHHYLYSRHISDSEWQDLSQISPTERGTILHLALRSLAIHSTQDPQEAIKQALRSRSFPLRIEEINILTENLQDYFHSPASELLLETEEDYSELPFLLKLKNGIIRGQIDRLVKKRDTWTLIDFKYSSKTPSADELIKTYGFQLKTYALAATNFLNQALSSIQIHLFGTKQAIEVKYDAKTLNQHKLFLEKLLTQMEKPDLSSIRKHQACHSCLFNHQVAICTVPKGKPWSSGFTP